MLNPVMPVYKATTAFKILFGRSPLFTFIPDTHFNFSRVHACMPNKDGAMHSVLFIHEEYVHTGSTDIESLNYATKNISDVIKYLAIHSFINSKSNKYKFPVLLDIDDCASGPIQYKKAGAEYVCDDNYSNFTRDIFNQPFNLYTLTKAVIDALPEDLIEQLLGDKITKDITVNKHLVFTSYGFGINTTYLIVDDKDNFPCGYIHFINSHLHEFRIFDGCNNRLNYGDVLDAAAEHFLSMYRTCSIFIDQSSDNIDVANSKMFVKTHNYIEISYDDEFKKKLTDACALASANI